ncbi:MAG TPA: HEAT repeat domain-containing protein [Polyangia bacterium]|jgi:HEAT repeat protein|nr:HEAT repeat domain-containing protein [Polyangia bacterium]
MISPDRFSFTPAERERLERIERLVADGTAGVAPLIDLLDDPSWTVRRAVVAGLAAGGSAVIAPLCHALRHRRDDEARIAATVDALAALNVDVDSRLVVMADDPDPAIVADVAQILGRRRATVALPTLVALTHHQNDNVAVAAIEALGRVGGRAAVDSLVEAVRSGNFFRTFPAIDVLGRSGDPRAVAPLTALLDEPQYAAEAARALGRTGDRAAVAPLMALLGRGIGAMVRVAALALTDLRQRNAEHFGSGERIDEAIAEAGGAGIVRQVVRALSDGDSTEKAALCFVLAILRDASTVQALTALLDGPVEVVEAASDALKRIGPEADAQILREIRGGGTKRALLPLLSRTMAAPDVVACLADAEVDVRLLACEALGRMGATDAVAALFPLLADPNPRVAFAALSAIQALGGRETETLTLAAVRSPEARVRRAAVRILAYFGFDAALDPILAALADSDERVREAAIQGLPFFENHRALEALMAAAKDPVDRTRAVAMRALGQCVGDMRVSAYLVRGLGDPDPWTRYYACQALGRLAFEPAAEAIGRLLADPAGQVRVAAVEALAFLKGETALAALEAAVSDAEPDVQRAALVGLGVARRIKSLPLMLAAAAAGDPPTRIVALSAVAAFKSPDVLRVLGASAVDPDPGVTTVAIGLLSTIPGVAATMELANLLVRSSARELIVAALSVHIEGRVSGLSAALETADDETAGALTSALARLRRPDATAALLGTMTSSNSRARKAAASTLAGLGQPDALHILRVAAANDPEPEVRRICSLLLSR